MLTDNHGRLTVEITRNQLETWAGRSLTDDQIARLDIAIPFSSIPEAIGTIVSETFDDDDKLQLLTLMAALDNGTNVFGKLPADIRSRLYAVVSKPSKQTWVDARSIMINNEQFLTLWKACLRYTDYDVVAGDDYYPSQHQLMTALVAGLG